MPVRLLLLTPLVALRVPVGEAQRTVACFLWAVKCAESFCILTRQTSGVLNNSDIACTVALHTQSSLIVGGTTAEDVISAAGERPGLVKGSAKKTPQLQCLGSEPSPHNSKVDRSQSSARWHSARGAVVHCYTCAKLHTRILQFGSDYVESRSIDFPSTSVHSSATSDNDQKAGKYPIHTIADSPCLNSVIVGSAAE